MEFVTARQRRAETDQSPALATTSTRISTMGAATTRLRCLRRAVRADARETLVTARQRQVETDHSLGVAATSSRISTMGAATTRLRCLKRVRAVVRAECVTTHAVRRANL